MSTSIQLVPGGTVDLPPGLLTVRLTAAVGGAQLLVIDGHGRDVSQDRHDDVEAVVRPQRGALRVVAAPTHGHEFAPGARLGAEIRVLASVDGTTSQVLVADVDAGALPRLEVARLDYVEGRGWIVAASSRDPFGDLLGAEVPRSDPVPDERELPWLSAGRYHLRRATRGAIGGPGHGDAWALILDNSASMSELLPPDATAETLETICGMYVEMTGQMPTAVGASGLLGPAWIDHATREPRRLLDAVSADGPPSWCLVAPALAEAIDRGAGRIAVVTDGPPADIAVSVDLARRSMLDVDLIVLTSRTESEQAHPNAWGIGFDALRAAPNCVLSALSVGPTGVADADWARLARSLTRVAS